MTNLPDVIALGETMRSVVTVVGLPGEPPIELVTHGGAESNSCVALAGLGFGAAWVSRLGTDDAGDHVLEELAEALKSAQPIQHPENIELVKKYWEKIDAVLQ